MVRGHSAILFRDISSNGLPGHLWLGVPIIRLPVSTFNVLDTMLGRGGGDRGEQPCSLPAALMAIPLLVDRSGPERLHSPAGPGGWRGHGGPKRRRLSSKTFTDRKSTKFKGPQSSGR